MKHSSSSSSRCLQPKAQQSCREIKSRTWGKEGCEIMHNFIRQAKHQTSAISAAQGGKKWIGHLGIWTNWGMQDAHFQGGESASKEIVHRKNVSERTWGGEKNPKHRIYRKLTMTVKWLVLYKRDRDCWEREFGRYRDVWGWASAILLQHMWNQSLWQQRI